ncbi:TetR/AcrR family transcriptional regulator, partial [Odoribacter sp. OttesenSCG-928-J03]|nr:TetR/AcrR family transcriptional regulator [Odoribacter sp. OttesenSCG-928-J03]
MNVEQLRKDIDKKEIELLTGIMQEGKETGIFKVNDPVGFSKNLLLMFKSLEQAFILAGHRNRNSRRILEYIDLMFYGIMNEKR